jgi:hypothetical protein
MTLRKYVNDSDPSSFMGEIKKMSLHADNMGLSVVRLRQITPNGEVQLMRTNGIDYITVTPSLENIFLPFKITLTGSSGVGGWGTYCATLSSGTSGTSGTFGTSWRVLPPGGQSSKNGTSWSIASGEVVNIPISNNQFKTANKIELFFTFNGMGIGTSGTAGTMEAIGTSGFKNFTGAYEYTVTNKPTRGGITVTTTGGGWSVYYTLAHYINNEYVEYDEGHYFTLYGSWYPNAWIGPSGVDNHYVWSEGIWVQPNTTVTWYPTGPVPGDTIEIFSKVQTYSILRR